MNKAEYAASQDEARRRALIAWMDSQEIPDMDRGLFLARASGYYLGKMCYKGRRDIKVGLGILSIALLSGAETYHERT